VNSLRRACVLLSVTAGLGLALVPVASADPVQTVEYASENGAGPLEAVRTTRRRATKSPSGRATVC
jgi:hypothetical protein